MPSEQGIRSGHTTVPPWLTTTQRVWFLAPTVELCLQQHGVLSAALPSYATLVLTGSDNVDRWSEQRIWDAALDGVRVVASTYAVLADALHHGFVRISDLALLVFDEGEPIACFPRQTERLTRTIQLIIASRSTPQM